MYVYTYMCVHKFVPCISIYVQHMILCVCVHVCACVCMCMCVRVCIIIAHLV